MDTFCRSAKAPFLVALSAGKDTRSECSRAQGVDRKTAKASSSPCPARMRSS